MPGPAERRRLTAAQSAPPPDDAVKEVHVVPESLCLGPPVLEDLGVVNIDTNPQPVRRVRVESRSLCSSLSQRHPYFREFIVSAREPWSMQRGHIFEATADTFAAEASFVGIGHTLCQRKHRLPKASLCRRMIRSLVISLSLIIPQPYSSFAAPAPAAWWSRPARRAAPAVPSAPYSSSRAPIERSKKGWTGTFRSKFHVL